jgi:hypothetical protein
MTAALLISCSADDSRADDPVSIWPVPVTGRLPDHAPANTTTMGAGAPNENPPSIFLDDDGGVLSTKVDPGLASFDPNEVYMFGVVEAGFPRPAVTLPAHPAHIIVGFAIGAVPASAVIRPSDGRLIYGDSNDRVLAFQCDECRYFTPDQAYPSNPESNDEQLPLVPCDDSPMSFAIAPDGRLYQKCGDRWYDPSGTELSLVGVLAFGYDGTVLTKEGIVDLATGTTVAAPQLLRHALIASRAQPDGYWIVQPTSDTGQLERWLVAFDGSASSDGTYPRLRDLVGDGATRLDGRGRLVQFANHIADRGSAVVVRSTIDGDNQVLYDEQVGPFLRPGTRDLFTGP